MSDLLTILAHDILPIFIVVGLGFAIGRRLALDITTLSRVAFYVLSPCLTFSALARSTIEGGALAQIALFVVTIAAIMGSLAWLAGRLFRLDAPAGAGLILVCMFMNSGNYGLGVTERAFGSEGLARAVIFFTTSTLIVYTAGISIAAGSDGSGLRGAIRRVFEVPPVYAVIGALLVRALALDLTHPALEPLLAGIDIAARATIPLMLIILGAQLARTSIAGHLRTALAASGLRLVAAPAIAWVLASAIGLSGVARQASILEASMPAAVINIILATEYRAAPELVTGAVLLSTLLSPITLTVVISLLK